MKALHGKTEKKRRMVFNVFMPATTLLLAVMILVAQRIAGPAILLYLYLVGLSLVCCLFLIVTQNKEIFITDEGVGQRLLFGAIRNREFLWTELVYVGEIDLRDNRGATSRYLGCTRKRPVRAEDGGAFRISPKDTILIDDLEENRAMLLPHFKGSL